MNGRIPRSYRMLIVITVLALVSQACAISLIKWPSFPTAAVNTPLPSGSTVTPAPRADALAADRQGLGMAIQTGESARGVS